MKEYKLTDICDFQGGTQPPKSEWINKPQDGYIRMLQIRDFTQGKSQHIEYVKDNKKVNKCNEDDILIARYGASIGKILSGLKGAYNVALIKTIPDEKILTKKYLQSILKSPVFQKFILNIGARAAQAGFNKEDLSRFKLALPSLQEQIHISEILIQAENLIMQRKESIALLDELLASCFLDMFESIILGEKNNFEKIENVTNFIDYRGKTPKKTENGVPFISAKCVRIGFFDEERLDYISKETYNKIMTRGLPQVNDVLFTTEGATMGFTCRIPKNLKKFAIGQRIITLQCKEKLVPEFLEFLLNHNYAQREIFKRSSGSAVLGIRSSEFKEIKIPIPPLKLQTQFSHVVKKVETLKTEYQASLRELENIYGVLSQKAFKGELKVKEYTNNEVLGMVAETKGGY